MTDGNTDIHVVPVLSEGEMKSFQELFSKIANTITQASSLAGEFEKIKTQVSGLTNDLEYQRSRNSTLDEAITHLRSERDEANRLLSEGRVEWNNLKNDYSNLQYQLDDSVKSVNTLETANTEIIKDRDEAMFKVLELTEELDKAKASLASIHKALGIVPAPEPKPEPIIRDELEKATPVFMGEGQGYGYDDPNMTPAPQTDAIERRKVYEGDEDYKQSVWYAAEDNDFGYDQTKEKRWYYADAKLEMPF